MRMPGLRCPLRCVEFLITRTRAPADHGRRTALPISFLKRKRSSAKRAFREHASKKPVRAAATWAMIHFILPVHGVIAARCRVKWVAPGSDCTQHHRSSSHFASLTSGESLCFRDDPRMARSCLPRATTCVSAGRYGAGVDIYHLLASRRASYSPEGAFGEAQVWSPTRVITGAELLRNEWRRSVQ